MADAPTPLVYTVPEVARVLRVRDAVAYGLVDTGEIPSVHVWSGGQRVVPRVAVEQYLARLVAAVAAPSSSPSASAAPTPLGAAAGEGGPGASAVLRGSGAAVAPESSNTAGSITWPTRKTKPRAGTRGSSTTSGRGRSVPTADAGRTEA